MRQFRSFLGIELPTFGAPEVKGEIAGNLQKAAFKGAVLFGSSEFETTLTHSLTNSRPSVTAKIVAPRVSLADVGIHSERPKDVPSEGESKPDFGEFLFSAKPLPFDALGAIDLLVSVHLDSLKGENFVLEKLDFDMSLDHGKLQIAPAKLTYENGSVSIDFTVNAFGPNPEMALKATAEDVDIGAVLARFYEKPFVEGQLNLVVDLHSAGNSPREIAEALKGEFGIALEKGKIKRQVEFMGADAVDFLMAVRSSKQYRDLNCLFLDFTLEQGVGRSEVIYIDTPDMFVRGRGQIDLHTETIDLVLQPKPKKDLWGTTSPVTIKGPILDPQVQKIPFREAVKLYGEIAMPMVFLPARGLGYLWYLIKKDASDESPCIGMRPENNNPDEAR